MAEPRQCAAPGCEELLPEGSRRSRKTCSDACRSTLARANHTARVHEVDAAAKSAVGQVVQDAVREYVNREVLTEDLLGRIKQMVGLTPDAISTLEDLLASEDAEVAIRAAQTILRYTMGNPSVAPPSVDVAPSPMSVTFNLPRAGDAISHEQVEVTETKMCGDCHVAKPLNEFVAGSARCQRCFDDIQEGVRAKLSRGDDTRPQ